MWNGGVRSTILFHPTNQHITSDRQYSRPIDISYFYSNWAISNHPKSGLFKVDKSDGKMN